jgi:dTMP kinase
MSDLTTHSRFISLEGGEGAGKTTVLNALRATLEADGAEVLCTREPGGTPFAETIRGWLLDQEASEQLAPETELLLMFAARAQHVRHAILPALRRGAWVISDRFTDSSYAYQGGGRGLPMSFIAELEQHVVGLRPALTLLLDVGVGEGRARARGRAPDPDRIEREEDDFFERVRQVFLQRAAAEPDRIRIVDAARPADIVAAEAARHVAHWRESIRA